eukprot:Hpha_TRINITY_DN20434_c0_g1::TRINITY_DN20434_c0_g1_i1::g.64145::m.64145
MAEVPYGGEVESWRLVKRGDPFLLPFSDVLEGVPSHSRLLAAVHLAFGIAALVLPPYFGYRYDGNFWKAMFSTNDAMTSMTLDVLIVAASVLLFTAVDMRRLGFSLLSLIFVIASCAVAVSFPVPIYLCMRTIRVAKIDTESEEGCALAAGTSPVCALSLFVL